MGLLAMAQVREAVVGRLMSTTPAGTEVFHDRAWPLNKLPALRVVVGDETVTPATVHWPNRQAHSLMVDVECTVQAVSGLDAQLDALHLAVASALQGSLEAVTLAPLKGGRLIYLGSRRELDTEGQSAVGRATLRFEAKFSTMASAPDALV